MARFQKYLELFDKDFIQEKLDEGLTIRKISYIVNIPEKRLCEMVKYFDLKVINKGVTYNVKHTYFNEIDTEEKAYILGFIVADGNVEVRKRKNKYSKRVSFCQGIQDKEIIESIRDIICPNKPVKWSNRSTKSIVRMDQANFKFSSDKIVEDLIDNYGILPNKTFNVDFKVKNIPDRLFRHFIRGFMDGDGHIARNSIEFIFTSEQFLKQLLTFFEDEGFTHRTKKETGKTIDYYRLYINFNKTNIVRIYEILYQGSSIHLKRKEEKLRDRINHLKLKQLKFS